MITTVDFYELLAEEELNPRGEFRADYRNAISSMTFASCMGAKDIDIETFMPKFSCEDDTKKEVTQEEFDGKLKCWGAGLKRIKSNG